MMQEETVHDRIDGARARLTAAQVAMGVGLLALLGAALLFVQEPTLHDAMHNFRHAAGITCH